MKKGLDNTYTVCYGVVFARENQATTDRRTVTRNPDRGKGVTLMDYTALVLIITLLIIVAIKK